MPWTTGDPVIAWLLDPSEPAMSYPASRDLVTPRPGEWTLARLRAQVPKAGWAAAILARQRRHDSRTPGPSKANKDRERPGPP